MQNLLAAKNLSRRYGERLLFEDISIGISSGEKIALIAKNGTGKSTLLSILAGIEEPDSGEISTRDGLRIAYLQQEPQLSQEGTIRDYIASGATAIRSVIDRYEQALRAQHAQDDTAARSELALASTQMDHWSAWDYDRQVEEMLHKLGITDLKLPMAGLSGGQRKRIAIVMMLIDQPDLLILDEPTNHLDIECIEWLEDYLLQASVSFLVVTHDRYFLDRVCTIILEMHHGSIYRHSGNYAYFLKKRAEREEALQSELDKDRKRLKREQEWVRRTPQARTTKSKARVDAYYELKKKASGQKREKEIQLDIKSRRIGGKVLELKNIKKSYGDLAIIDGFTYTFKKGERIGIAGPNGVGKSTFLRLITGEESADSGKRNVGDTIVFGHFRQTGLDYSPEDRVIDIVKRHADVIQLSDGSKLTASQFLEFFLFDAQAQFTKVSMLSGGERRRLHLLTVLISHPNFLILDEPTNDLDLITLSRLEEFLINYDGCLLIVSHDRYFMDQLVDHLFVFEGDGKIKDFNGNYSEYRARSVDLTDTVEEAPREDPEAERARRKQVKRLENMISSREREKKELEAKLYDPDLEMDEITRLSEKIGSLNEEIEDLTEEWMNLEE